MKRRHEEDGRFKYRRRSAEAIKKRSMQSGGVYDSIFLERFTVWRPKEGDVQFRILPRPEKDADHYGLDIFVHYGVGSDNQTYLCLDRTRGEPCPICEERRQAEKEGDPEYAYELAPKKRVVMWVVVRGEEKEGPQLYAMPYTQDRDIAGLCIKKKTGEVLAIDDPDEGYDVEFTRKGQRKKTKYISLAIDRDPSPISDDPDEMAEWLEFITEHPLTEVLNVYDYDYIAKKFAGKGKDEDDEDEGDEDDKPHHKARRRDRDEDDEDEDDEDPDTWRKPSREAKDDEDEDDDADEDEDEDEKPAVKAKRRPKDEDDEDEESEDDDDSDDEDEDEEEKPKRNKLGDSVRGRLHRKG